MAFYNPNGLGTLNGNAGLNGNNGGISTDKFYQNTDQIQDYQTWVKEDPDTDPNPDTDTNGDGGTVIKKPDLNTGALDAISVVDKITYVNVKKADGNLWEFPYDGADYGNDILLQSRPIKLDSDDLKGSFRVVLRGLFVGVEGKSSGLYVSGSIDGKKWMYLGGTERKHVAGVPVRDIGTTIERNSCRFLMVVYVGCLLPESKIEYVDITSTIRYSDKPR